MAYECYVRSRSTWILVEVDSIISELILHLLGAIRILEKHPRLNVWKSPFQSMDNGEIKYLGNQTVCSIRGSDKTLMRLQQITSTFFEANMSFFEDITDYGVIDVSPDSKYIPYTVSRHRYTDNTSTQYGDTTPRTSTRHYTTPRHPCLADRTRSISTNNPISINTGDRCGSFARSNGVSNTSSTRGLFNDDMLSIPGKREISNNTGHPLIERFYRYTGYDMSPDNNRSLTKNTSGRKFSNNEHSNKVII